MYAPNVRSGGGLVLLQALLDGIRPGDPILAILDSRAEPRLNMDSAVSCIWVKPGFLGRLGAEWTLRKRSRDPVNILCFHGLPPLLVRDRQVVVFAQNRLLLGKVAVSGMSIRTRVRTRIEEFVAVTLKGRVWRYVVQTPSMAREFSRWYGDSPPLVIAPFVGEANTPAQTITTDERSWDFVYVAGGEAHKNHRTLLKAWELLAREGVRPTLALTLGPGDAELWAEIGRTNGEHGLRILNIGQKTHQEIQRLYGNARALIFPSYYESFGLPLVEAAQLKLPIVAAELDYVRDVCSPAETFDPSSATSIARGVKRFLCLDGSVPPVMHGRAWLDRVFRA